MSHLSRHINDRLLRVLKSICFSKQLSNPKKATKCASVWWLLILCLFSPTVGLADNNPAQRFVSLTLCSDRLLLALAKPTQIAAMSPFSSQPQSMLGHINHNKPVVRARLSELLPYADAAILLNERFYPRLLARLNDLGFRVIGINDDPQTPSELFALLRRIAKLAGNPDKAEALMTKIKTTEQKIRATVAGKTASTALGLSENGLMNMSLPQNQVLLGLLNLKPVKGLAGASTQFSAEKLLLANPQVLLTFAFSSAYSDGGRWLEHPALQSLMQGRVQASTSSKYTMCFDHGVWEGAADLMRQLEQNQP